MSSDDYDDDYDDDEDDGGDDHNRLTERESFSCGRSLAFVCIVGSRLAVSV